MKKINKIFLLLALLIFLSTYTPTGFNTFPNKENAFFKIKNIEIVNNKLISKNEINKKLSHIYGSNILLIKGQDLEKPLVIYNYYNHDLQDKMINNTNAIRISNSKCTIIEVDIDKSKSALLSKSSIDSFNALTKSKLSFCFSLSNLSAKAFRFSIVNNDK